MNALAFRASGFLGPECDRLPAAKLMRGPPAGFAVPSWPRLLCAFRVESAPKLVGGGLPGQRLLLMDLAVCDPVRLLGAGLGLRCRSARM